VKTMRAPSECVGSRTPRTRTVLRAANVIITLKWPILSATALGTIRPMMLYCLGKLCPWDQMGGETAYPVAFRMGTKYLANFTLKPR
jgi:hypothetical protein